MGMGKDSQFQGGETFVPIVIIYGRYFANEQLYFCQNFEKFQSTSLQNTLYLVSVFKYLF